MIHPEGGGFTPPQPPEKEDITLDEIERLLELNDDNENIIERTKKREELLELLDQIEEG